MAQLVASQQAHVLQCAELAAIDTEWQAADTDITPLDITLARTDVTVTQLVLASLPVG